MPKRASIPTRWPCKAISVSDFVAHVSWSQADTGGLPVTHEVTVTWRGGLVRAAAVPLRGGEAYEVAVASCNAVGCRQAVEALLAPPAAPAAVVEDLRVEALRATVSRPWRRARRLGRAGQMQEGSGSQA